MRIVSYRNRQRLRKLLIALGIALAVLLIAAICIVIYLQRYIVYTRDGAHLDFGSRPGASETDTSEGAALHNPVHCRVFSPSEDSLFFPPGPPSRILFAVHAESFCTDYSES